jgi:hypothetical protein
MIYTSSINNIVPIGGGTPPGYQVPFLESKTRIWKYRSSNPMYLINNQLDTVWNRFWLTINTKSNIHGENLQS